jgi:hypothetical protein
MALLEDKKIPNELFIINGLTMWASGCIIVYNFIVPFKIFKGVK